MARSFCASDVAISAIEGVGGASGVNGDADAGVRAAVIGCGILISLVRPVLCCISCCWHWY